jgi:sirohydrochlorin cobaltochelatase
MPAGIILFAHGARDARWAEPFLRLREKVSRASPGITIALAYLEFMSPDLDTAVASLSAAGCHDIALVPVFLGQGGHLRNDVPDLLGRVAARYPECRIRLAVAAGEDDAVLDAIAAYSLRQLDA